MLDQEILYPTNYFEFKNFFFGATNILKTSDQENYVFFGYEITFDSAGSQSFDDDIARNLISFLVLIIVHHLIRKIVRITF